MKTKVIVITGGTAGVGRALARRFAAPGVRIAVLARGTERLRDVEDELAPKAERILGLSVDVSDPLEMRKAAAQIEQELGPIDVWINNATTSVVGKIAEVTVEEFRRVMEVTYLGYVNGTKAALEHMLPRNRGRIIQVSSGLAYRAIPLQAAYCAAKHAIKGFTESLRCELLSEKSGVTVSMVHLPAINTPQFDWTETRELTECVYKRK